MSVEVEVESREQGQISVVQLEIEHYSVVVLPARYVLLRLATELTGYSVKAMQRKIERGDRVEGKV